MRAIGVAPARDAPSAEARMSAAAPSFMGDEFPAVTVPPDRNTGFSRDSVSGVESARMHSSRASSAPSTETTS